MPDRSPRLDMPYSQPSQAQKHVTHNEALRQLDISVQLVVVAFDAATPPAAPVTGDIHALGAAPTGVWAGAAGQLAQWDGEQWVYLTPAEGWSAVARSSGETYRFTGGLWEKLLPPTDNLDHLGINTTADTQNRLAVQAPQSLFTHDGAGHQMKINKATAADTAGIVFQTDWNGHAAFELAGDNDLSLKLSPDGSSWLTAMTVSHQTGHMGVMTAPDATNALSLGGSLSLSGNLTFDTASPNLTYLGAAIVTIRDTGISVMTGTSDGTDTRACTLSGGGGTNIYRGAVLRLHGNEHSTAPGEAKLESGYNNDIILATHGAGKIGLGTLSPARQVHVGDVMRLEPTVAPATPGAGDLYFDAATSKLRCHDGSTWHDLF